MLAELVINAFKAFQVRARRAYAAGAATPLARLIYSSSAMARFLKHRRPVAIALSIGLHILFVICLLPHSRSGFSTGGRGGHFQGDGEGLSLDLAALADAQGLSEVVPDASSLSQPQPAQDASAAPAQAAANRQGGEGQGGTSSGTFDDLWAAIAPCWRRIADSETLPVNLTVSFAGNGMLARPPEIMRKAEDASNARALRSESLAITALAECGVYQMAAGRENVSIQFPMP